MPIKKEQRLASTATKVAWLPGDDMQVNFLKSGLGRITRSRILRDSSVLFVGNWVNLLIALVTSAMLVRLLGPEGYGAVAVAMTAVNFVITFIDAQTDEALIR